MDRFFCRRLLGDRSDRSTTEWVAGMEARKFQELFFGGGNGDIEKCNNIDNFDLFGNCCVPKYVLSGGNLSFSCFHDIVKKSIFGRGQHHRNGTKCPLSFPTIKRLFPVPVFFLFSHLAAITTMKRDVNGFIG